MSIKKQLLDDMKTAMKAGDSKRLGCIRMLKSRIQESEVARRADDGKDYELSDEEATQVIATYGKQRRDSIAAFREAGRDDLADKEQEELEIVSAYLPEPLGEEELRSIVQAAIEESGATSAREMGAVMKLVMPQVRGRADGKQVNAVVRLLLGS